MRLRFLTCALLLCACARSERPGVEGPAAAAQTGTPVAHFDGQTLSLEDLRARAKTLPADEAAKLSSPEGRRAWVESVASFDLLAQEAARRGLANDPDVVAAARRVMVHKLLAQLSAPAPTEAEIAAWYTAHADRFAQPAQYRLGQVVIPSGDEKAAARIAKRLAAIYPEDEPLMKKAADDVPGASIDVDLRYQTLDALAARFGAPAADAIRPLGEGGHSTAVVRLADGLHLFWFRGKLRGLTLSLDEVRPGIAAQLEADARSKAIEAFEKKLATDAHLSIDDAALARLAETSR
jgi:peptidyl-prolyl cis-trans isomerase C